jgi:pimeloyl-ACP methyl ester carboxylesterase
VAHDVGGFVAQVIARRAPERVQGLFFFNCAYPGIGARWVEPRHLLETWYGALRALRNAYARGG